MRLYRWVAQWVEWLLRFQIVRYGISGGISHAVDFGVFTLLYKGFDVWYVYATVLSGTLAWMVNFPLHRNWTFDVRRGAAVTTLQGASHYGLKLWNIYLLTPFLLHWLVEGYGWSPVWIKLFLPVGIGLFQNLPLCRYVIFRKPAK